MVDRNENVITVNAQGAVSDDMCMEQLIDETTSEYISELEGMKVLPRPKVIAAELISRTAERIVQYNKAQKVREMRLPVPKVLDPLQIATLILKFHNVVKVSSAGEKNRDSYPLAVYQTCGPNEGIYSVQESAVRNLIRQYRSKARKSDLDDTILCLGDNAPIVHPCAEKDLVAVNNGIFDYKAKKLMPFTPEKVFLSKSPVNYVFGAPNPKIYNSEDNTNWDVESWMKEIAGTPEMADLLWRITGAVIRPLVGWDKAALLYADNGNNGKGTLCKLMRNLCGPENCVSISLNDFSEKFALGPLIGASAVITDENKVGGFLDDSAKLKAVITGDTVQIDRKFKPLTDYTFQGVMVQCVNELPKIKDKTGSVARRILCVPFEKCFTGAERKYIKHDYIARPEVLEYVLYKVLHMDYDKLGEPDECKALMAEFRENNNPVLAFWNEFRDRFAWDLLPFGFLYDLYKSWYTKNTPGGSLLGSRTFSNELRKVTADDAEWAATRTDGSAITTGNKMNAPEVLIVEYGLNLNVWGTPKTNSPIRCCIPQNVEKGYKGLYRKVPTTACSSGD